MRRYIETRYGREGCEALDNMTKQEVAAILAGIEGWWIAPRPYLDGEEMAEHEFERLRVCKALSLAAEWLRDEG